MGNNISESYIRFVNVARELPGFVVGQKEDVPYDITDLMNKYCQAKDTNNRYDINRYLSALMVRYWHVAILLYKQSVSTRLDFDDIVVWMYDAFEKAAHYRSWMDVNKDVSKNPKGAEKCINQCITSVRQYWYKHFNQDKRKINYITSSLDDLIQNSDSDDVQTTILDTVADVSESKIFSSGRELVQKYIDSGDLFTALVLDTILYQDCFVDSTEVTILGVDDDGNNIESTHYKSEFSHIKLKKHLKNLNTAFVNYFSSTYDLDDFSEEDIVRSVDGLTSIKLGKKIKSSFEILKNDKEILSLLCM
jgi:hypothetical protein